jgi:hypothetical protein
VVLVLHRLGEGRVKDFLLTAFIARVEDFGLRGDFVEPRPRHQVFRPPEAAEVRTRNKTLFRFLQPGPIFCVSIGDRKPKSLTHWPIGEFHDRTPRR